RCRRCRQRSMNKHGADGQREGSVIDIQEILELLPHRYPFVLVDRVLEFTPGVRIVALKNVTINEPFFTGHFPNRPVMPGVLIIESMAQVGGMLLLNSIDEPEKKLIFFMSIDKAKFRKPVTPGDQLIFELKMLRNRGKTFVMAGTASVDGAIVAEAELMAAIVDKETK